MKYSPLLIFSALSLAPHLLHAQELTPADREALLSRLEALENGIDQRVDARYRQAVAAYREAMSSEEAAFSFYLKCIEKVEYEDQKKKTQDFREWRRKEDANLSKASFRRALRHQLRWLCVTLEAASSTSNRSDVTSKARGIVGDLFNDLKSVSDQERVLGQSVTGTVFAKAYGIDKVKIEDWPMSPFNVADLFDKLFLPPLRVVGKSDELRAAWMRRIQMELQIRETMGRFARNDTEEGGRRGKQGEQETKRVGMAENMRPPEYELFVAQEVPALQWQMELDIYKIGDRTEGAKRLLAHIENNITHPSVKEWSAEFKELLTPKPTAPGAETAPSASPSVQAATADPSE
ncbi:MAG: hypothetical protein QM627_01845 [Luteolibacter sp.]